MDKLVSSLKNTLLVIISVIISILTIESTLWIFNLPPYTERIFNGNMPDSDTGFTLRNNYSSRLSSWEYDTVVKVNNAGFLSHDNVTGETSPDIFMLGDSFAQGVGVNLENNLASQLQLELITPNISKDKLVINLGVNGYSTIQEVIRFQKYIEYFSNKPSDAVLVFYTGNDYYDNRRYVEHLESTGEQLQTSSNGFVVPNGVTANIVDGDLVWVQKGKVIFSGPYGGFYPPKGYENKLFDWSKIYNLWAWISVSRQNECQIPVAIPGLLNVNYDFNNSREWILTKRALNDFILIAKNNDINPHIVIMPSKYHLNSKLLEDAGCSIETVDLETSVDFIEKFSEIKNVHSINLLKKFRDLATSEQNKLYYKVDSHLTPYGNSIAAEIIAKELK